MALIHFLPLPEVGHAAPAMAIGRRLGERGHSVAFLALPAIERYLRACGVPTLSLGEELVGGTELDARANVRALAAAARNGRLDAFIAKRRPDVVVADVILAAYLLCYRRAGIPGLALSTFLPDRIERGALPARTPGEAGVRGSLVRGLAHARLSIRTWLARRTDWDGSVAVARGEVRRQRLPRSFLAAKGRLATLQLPVPTLVACSACFDSPRRPDPLRAYVGPCVDLERDEAAVEWPPLESGRPLVLCSFGSRAHLLSEYPGFLALLAATARRHPELACVCVFVCV